jgi:hypothetical protein
MRRAGLIVTLVGLLAGVALWWFQGRPEQAERAALYPPVERPQEPQTEAQLPFVERLPIPTPSEKPALDQPSEEGLWIQAIPVHPAEASVDVRVFLRTKTAGWTSLGTLPADQRVLWPTAQYPCEIVAQSPTEFGTVLLESAPPRTDLGPPEVEIELQPCGSISGYITPENSTRIPTLEDGEVYYLASEFSQLPRTRQELLALPGVLGGMVELEEGLRRYSIQGLNPSKTYKLWAASISKSTLQAKQAWPGDGEVKLELYDVLGFCAELLYDGRPYTQPCGQKGQVAVGVILPQESMLISGLHAPLRWTHWSPGFPNSHCSSLARSMILTTFASGPTPHGQLNGGWGELQFQQELVPYSPLDAAGNTKPVQVELLQPPLATGELRLTFCCNPNPAPLPASERSIGSLRLTPLNGAGHYRSFFLVAEDYPHFSHPCIPAGRYEISFESSDTHLYTLEDPLPIVVIEPQQCSAVSMELPAWGSLEVHLEDPWIALDPREHAVGLLEAKTIARLAADPSVPTDQLISPDLLVPAGRTRLDFIPSGTWYVDPTEPNNPRLHRLQAIEVLAGQTTRLRLTLD